MKRSGRLHLAWRRTWPDGEANDFSAVLEERFHDGPAPYVRIRQRSERQARWSWAISDGHYDIGGGLEPGARQAALCAERAWAAYVAGREIRRVIRGEPLYAPKAIPPIEWE